MADDEGYTGEELATKLGKKDSSQINPDIMDLKKNDIIYGWPYKKLSKKPGKKGNIKYEDNLKVRIYLYM